MSDQHLIDGVLKLAHSSLHNYVIPGLTSSLIGGNGCGTVRLFDSSRDYEGDIAPHSHRFDLSCLVLRGTVTNRLWRECQPERGDEYAVSSLVYGGKPGEYTKTYEDRAFYTYDDTTYAPMESYSMDYSDIHSIRFSRDALLLIFEGPTLSLKTTVLEPAVNGVRIPTFEVKPWMFQK